jgi:hypothetical protein
MAKKAQTKTAAKKSGKTKGNDSFDALIESQTSERKTLPDHPARVKQFKTAAVIESAPHYKFDVAGQELAFKPTSEVIPMDGEFKGKLIGWNGVNLDTGEKIMIGNTHQIEKGFRTLDDKKRELWRVAPGFVIKWNGKSNLGNGKTFNSFDIQIILE